MSKGLYIRPPEPRKLNADVGQLAIGAELSKSFNEAVLEKSLHDPDWYLRFMSTSLEKRALQVEKEYQMACKKLDEQHAAHRKTMEAARKKYDKMMSEVRKKRSSEVKYYDDYDKRHAVREKYEAQKRLLMIDWLDQQQKMAKSDKSITNPTKNDMVVEKSFDRGDDMSKLNELYDHIRSVNVDDLLKGGESMSTLQHGENHGNLGSPGSNDSRMEAHGKPSANQKTSSESMEGMPSVSTPDQMLSEDDDAVMQQLKEGGMKPLERSVPKMENPGLKATADAVMSKSDRDIARFDAAEERMLRAGVADLQGVGVGVSSGHSSIVQKSEEVAVWAQGRVLYSNADDVAISKAQDSQGFITPEPTLGIPHTQLTKGHCCHMCKSTYPAMFSVCPDCGVEKGGYTGSYQNHGTIVMDQEVSKSIRPPEQASLSLPNGLVITTESE